MSDTKPNTPDMKMIWNGAAGHAWVETQDVMDAMFKPYQEMLVQAVQESSKTRVLDVGCGAGATTLAVASMLEETGSVTGLDISAPLIEAATKAAEKNNSMAKFICADAQDYALAASSFDMIISRFGVMFFRDSVAAFSNLHQAASKNGELCMFAWRGPAENAFMMTAVTAASEYLPDLPKPAPNAPGQFGFADSDYVTTTLLNAGWKNVKLEKVDPLCSVPASELIRFNSRLGVLGMVLQDVEESRRQEILTKVRAAFEPFIVGDEAQFNAACWKITASAN